ncbi:MAG: PQQ-binding-like beta-propeller repeat protein [Chthoniobacteraceae bacterium]
MWRAPAGCGWASPVVAEGRVFLIDSELVKPIARERVRCFEAATGKMLWSFAYEVTYAEWAFVPGQGGGPSATPVVEAGRVFAFGGNGHVHCLDAASGAVIWENDLRKSYEVRELQCRASPLIEGDLLILPAGAKPGACVLALDKKTGREVWKALDDAPSNSSPIVVVAGGQRQLIVWTDDSVASLDPATGATWWREPMTTSNNDSIPTPVVEGNRLLISGLMFALNAAKPDATVLWPGILPATKRLLSNTSSPFLRGEYIFSAKSGGELVCLRASDGALVWKANTVTGIKGGASIHITPTPDGDLLYTDQGNLIRAQLAPEGFREISRAHLIDPTTPFAGRNCAWAPPAFANGHVFARSDRELVCASLKEDAARSR